MRDIKQYLEKLHGDAEDCILIARLATDPVKRDTFKTMAEAYQKLASDLDKIVAAHAMIDDERDRRLLGLLGNEDAASNTAEIAQLLGQTPSEP